MLGLNYEANGRYRSGSFPVVGNLCPARFRTVVIFLKDCLHQPFDFRVFLAGVNLSRFIWSGGFGFGNKSSAAREVDGFTDQFRNLWKLSSDP